MNDPELNRLALQSGGMALLGWLWQWARGPKTIPNWATYLIFGSAGVLVWFWATPNAAEMIIGNWRVAILMAFNFVLGARGAAASSKDAKVAPQTNSL